MSDLALTLAEDDKKALYHEQTKEYVTFKIDGQIFGIEVTMVNDVLDPQKIARIPLAPQEVAGALNLRGRIVTAFDLKNCLGLGRYDNPEKCMSLAVDYKGEMYSLLFDTVGDVLTLPAKDFEKSPANMERKWKEISQGVYKLQGSLLVILDVEKVISIGN